MRKDKWVEDKLQAWQRMWEDLEIGYLDEDILDVLIEIFSRPHSYPKSSCSGRIVALDADNPWVKDETAIVFKKHSRIEQSDLEHLLRIPVRSILWLVMQGPIYHVYTKTLEEALALLEIAREAGFKHSGILSISDHGVVVELRTGIRIAIPLRTRDERIIGDTTRLIEILNNMLIQAKERNRRLLEALRRNKPKEKWEPPTDILIRT